MFDRKLWSERFTSFPTWPCPTCSQGRLTIIENSLKNEETQLSKKYHSDDAWEPDWIEKRFTAHLTCSEKSCGEGAVIAGTARSDLDYGYDHDGNTEINVYDVFFPSFIFPAPMVIALPEETPIDVRREIQKASSLIWIDVSSSANKLRLTVERILTALKIKKTQISGGKRKPIALATRITALNQTKPEIADLLHSIRFLGNEASHESLDGVDRNDLLSAFEIMEHVIELTFSQKAKRIKTVAKDIKRRRGKPPAQARRKLSDF